MEWNPCNEALFASCSDDKRVNIWDLSKLGDEQRQEDAEDGPPELIFVHGGHRGKVRDFNWNMTDGMYIASTEVENNVVQVWEMASSIYEEDPLL